MNHGHASTGKGKKQSPTYNSWRSMIQRCTNTNHTHYSTYSNLGMDNSWKSFDNFLTDMGVRPDGTSLDRVNNELGYFKDNCRWASSSEQQRNKSNNVLSSELAERIHSLKASGLDTKQIARVLKVHRSTITNVIYRGDWA